MSLRILGMEILRKLTLAAIRRLQFQGIIHSARTL
jgi:hypothetical protein